MLTEGSGLVSAGAPARTAQSVPLWCCALCAALLALATQGAKAASVAVLEFELVKSDLAGPATPDELARLERAAERIRERLSQEGYTVVDAERTREASRDAAKTQYLHACNGCERAVGRALESDWVLVGWVQIVSNLILNLNVVVRDVTAGKVVAKAFVDLRGNNDKAWARATDYMLENVLIERLSRKTED